LRPRDAHALVRSDDAVRRQVRSTGSCFEINELLLYHGCKAEAVAPILRQGFDAGRAGERNGSLFGPGTYFTDVAAKADTYSSLADSGQSSELLLVGPLDAQARCMILAQVCLGEPLRALRAMPRGLEAVTTARGTQANMENIGSKDIMTHRLADCDGIVGEDVAHGGVLDHREYVVFEDAQALPRYLVWYVHNDACGCFRCSFGHPRLAATAVTAADQMRPESGGDQDTSAIPVGVIATNETGVAAACSNRPATSTGVPWRAELGAGDRSVQARRHGQPQSARSRRHNHLSARLPPSPSSRACSVSSWPAAPLTKQRNGPTDKLAAMPCTRGASRSAGCSYPSVRAAITR